MDNRLRDSLRPALAWSAVVTFIPRRETNLRSRTNRKVCTAPLILLAQAYEDREAGCLVPARQVPEAQCIFAVPQPTLPDPSAADFLVGAGFFDLSPILTFRSAGAAPG